METLQADVGAHKRIRWASTRLFKYLQNIYIYISGISLILLSRSAAIECSRRMSLLLFNPATSSILLWDKMEIQ